MSISNNLISVSEIVTCKNGIYTTSNLLEKSFQVNIDIKSLNVSRKAKRSKVSRC